MHKPGVIHPESRCSAHIYETKTRLGLDEPVSQFGAAVVIAGQMINTGHDETPQRLIEMLRELADQLAEEMHAVTWGHVPAGDECVVLERMGAVA